MQVETPRVFRSSEMKFLEEQNRLAIKRARLQRISDDEWENIVQALPRNLRARAIHDHSSMRMFLEATLWVADTELAWQALPRYFGKFHGHYVRFTRWAGSGWWPNVAASLSDPELRTALMRISGDYARRQRVRGAAREQADRL